MRTLYLDCGMGAAGDMLSAALLELFDDKDAMLSRLRDMGIPGVQLAAKPSEKCGILGTHLSVTVNGEGEESADVLEEAFAPSHAHEHSHEHPRDHSHHHSHEHAHDHPHEHAHDHPHTHETHSHNGIKEIRAVIEGLCVPEKVKETVLSVYKRIADAESAVHNRPVEEIHFHEVGALDAVFDIAAACYLLYELKVEKVIVSPVHVGSGKVRCAHGILPVPAPATARILQNVPIYGGQIQGELCTPTGAALLTTFADSFGSMPVMRVEKIGYGMGKKDFPAANCIRAMLGETEEEKNEISELCCNLDDMTPEEIGYALNLLMEEGALDVYITSIGMKKSRPGVMLTCMCPTSEKERFTSLLFRHTTTLGIREYTCRRYTLNRKSETLSTPYGPVRVKTASGYGISRKKAEYEDLKRIADETGLSLREIRKQIAHSSRLDDPKE